MSFRVCAALGFLAVIAFGVFGYAVPDDTSVALSCPPNAEAFIDETITCTATVTNITSGAPNGTPQGTVTVAPTSAGTVSGSPCTLDAGGQCTVTYTPTANPGIHGFNLTYTSDDNTRWNDSTGFDSITVKLRTTTTAIVCSPTTVAVDEALSCTVTVTDVATGTASAPEGTITLGQTAGGGTSTPCVLAASGPDTSGCVAQYTPTDAVDRQVTAGYAATDGVHADSSGSSALITVTARLSQTIVECSPTPLPVNASTQCTATVTDISGGSASVPTGTVTFSSAPGTDGGFDTPSCSLDAQGRCSVTYTPTNAATTPHTIAADYGGDAKHDASGDTFNQVIGLRAADVQLSCDLSELFIEQTTTCTVTVVDDTTAGTPITPQGSVGFDDAGKAGAFSAASCSLDAQGQCSVSYTPKPGDAGTSFATTPITATYTPATAPAVHATGSTVRSLTVRLRPTTTIIECKNSDGAVDGLFVAELGTCTITVKDEGPAPTLTPTGSVTTGVNTGAAGGSYTLSGNTCGSLTAGGAGESTCSFNYTVNSLSIAAGFHTLSAAYNGSSTYEVSGSGFGWAIQRRTTKTEIVCDAAGNCTATVTEDAAVVRGSPSTPEGKILNPADGSILCSPLAGGSCTFSVPINAISVVAAGQYESTNGVHLDSVGSDIIQSSIPPTGPGGSKDIAQTITDLNTACTVAEGVILALDAALIVIDLTVPEPSIGLGAGPIGLVIVTTTKIKVAEILAAVLQSAQIVLDTFILISCTDIDGDGLPGVVENDIGTSDTQWDFDSDGLGDGDEIFNTFAQGLFGANICPSPINADSDGDGLLDGPEDEDFGTEFCSDDSDEDGATLDPSMKSDYYEVMISKTSPTDPDTDDDGLCDLNGTQTSTAPGILKGCPVHPVTGLVRSEQSAGTDSLNPDTDGDGLLDGEEDLDGDGIFGLADTSTALGYAAEPDPTRFDTDADGLSDGFELGSGSGCDPSLADTDGDGLSDNEEQNRTFTTCSVADSDGDGLTDINEVFIIGGSFPDRQFEQVGDPLDPDTDDDGLTDPTELPGGTQNGTVKDTTCPFINDDDSDDDAVQDGAEFTVGDVAAASGNDGELNDDPVVSVCDPDADGDGILDGVEIGLGVNPLDWDSDDDGLSDREELQVYFTDPNDPDTDGDTADGVIAARAPASAPTLAGHSGAGTIACLSDCEEALSGTEQFNFPVDFRDETDPLQADTDGDGINDNIEFRPGCNVDGGMGTLLDGYANSFDSDADGLRDKEDAVPDVADAPTPNRTPVIPDPNNQGELEVGERVTGICDPDSDGDGILDGEEFQIGTDPYDWDTDDDGRGDGEFLGEGPIPTDPFDFDTDNDGLGDGVEVFGANTTNPLSVDTDGDGLCDGGAETPFIGLGNPLDPRCFTGVGDHPNPNGFGEDRDGDGVLPAATIGDSFSPGCVLAAGTCETDPNNPDSDSDGILDGIEALAFSTSRSTAFIDERGRPTRAVYPSAADPPTVFSCLNPLDADSDDDGLPDGFEDANQDGNWDFLVTDFDFAEHAGSGGVRPPDPEETNPCDPDTDRDSNPGSVNSFGAAGGNSSDAEERQRGTNPLDFDSDNDLLDDGVEVAFVCVAPDPVEVDNDNDGLLNEDPIDGLDNDGDGLVDEDPEDFTFITVPNLDPNIRDSDADGILDGLEDFNLNDQFEPGIGETNPCASPPIPLVIPVDAPRDEPTDTDGDGFADEDERAAGTDLHDPDDHPAAFIADLDFDGLEDDRLWLEDPDGNGIADAVALDINSNLQVDARIEVIEPRDLDEGDFDEDGAADDCRYIVVYAFGNQRPLQPRVVLTIYDYDCDLVIDAIELERR